MMPYAGNKYVEVEFVGAAIGQILRVDVLE